ncbi:P-loop containing nucleoside triphosphate hydrolase protein [Nemania sp. FL0031]|nr:P-loop containing nucleoside triphosphate hydrolase protein [Nemania sp. FL0031]
MEQTQSTPGMPTDDTPNAWIKYRVEYRDTTTNELVNHYDTKEMNSNPEDNHESDGEAFVLVTTYYQPKKRSPPAEVADTTSPAQSPSTAASPPLYSIHLTSPAIVNALRSVVQYYPSQDLTGDIVVRWPYPILVHHYDELVQFREGVAEKDEAELCEREKRAYEDLGLLLQYLDNSVMPGVLQERERNENGYFTFEYMWVLWKPGTTVLQTPPDDMEFYAPFVIEGVSGGTFQYPSREWSIWFWHMRYDGQYLGRYRSSSNIMRFNGQLDLRFTIVGDLENRDDLPEKVSDQLRYGEAYWKLLQKQCRRYKGKTRDTPSKEVSMMVDMKSYYSDHPRPHLMDSKDCRKWRSDCKCEVCKSKMTDEKDSNKIVSLFEGYNNITVEGWDALPPHMYFLCYPEMPAFVFKTRTWETLHVKDFSEPRFDEDLIEHLVMEPQRKMTLKALAKSFARSDKNGERLEGEPWTADFIQGKGHGLIFLLHGRPGVGKTYTAECIAAFTKRPLMVLTSSDIGTNPSEIEVNLTYYFKAAKSWGAVLLIDEADVFMERRSTADLVRNSLVAGFLRALEFYDGILFLTTNRVGSFDDAFISRVHVQLYYPGFTDDQRLQIWETFTEKLERERGDYMRLNIDAKEYIRGNEMRALALNGREIRNAFQTAVSLAEYDAKKGEDGRIVITDEHLRAVVDLSRDFKTYLDELHQGNEAKRAERKYERLDSYTRP